MKHSVTLYDTGKVDWLNRRNEGWAFASMMGGGMCFLFALVFGIAAVTDPSMTGAAPFCWTIVAITLANFAMFATHRNFMAGEQSTKVLDAIYSLPKEDRKRYKISRREIEALDSREADELINTIREYRRNRVTNSGVNAMLGEMKEFNKVVKEIEA